MSAHTPGPWSIDTYGDQVLIVDDSGNHVANCTPANWARDERIALAEANAHLISTAPDLLAALQGVMDILGRAESNASGNPDWDHVGPRVAAARAALAKVVQP